jgi:hypothetical protein
MYIFTAQIFLLEQVAEYTFTKLHLLAWRYRVYKQIKS